MAKIKVYDLPTRAFHWLFALLFILSFSVGKFFDDDSWAYAYHMLSGLTMSFIVLLRIFWGLQGTKYSLFSSFKLKPLSLFNYFQSILKGTEAQVIGHNPASSYAAILMFALTFLLTTTGFLMVNGLGKEFFEEVHEIFALIFALLVVLHISGVVFHQFRHRDAMIFSMITGNKNFVKRESSISGQAPLALTLFLILTFSFITYLLINFDTDNQSLDLFGKTIQLGEQTNDHDADYYNKYYKEL